MSEYSGLAVTTINVTRLIQQARSWCKDKVTQGLFSLNISGLVLRNCLRHLVSTTEICDEDWQIKRMLKLSFVVVDVDQAPGLVHSGMA